MRILVVEDNPQLTRNIQRYLQLSENYVVDAAFDGDTGLQKALSDNYDCIVLDIKLPGMDGFRLCAELRKRRVPVPVLMLTSLTGKDDAVKGLDAGADDYLKKPFALEELSARIRALLRRTPSERTPSLQAKDIEVDPNSHRVTKGDKDVELAPKEYSLLEYLLRNKNTVQPRQAIIEHVWGEHEEAMFSKTLDVHVAYLRKKLGKDSIVTVAGAGYLVSDSEGY